MSTAPASTLGTAFAESLMAKDFERLESLLDDEIDFRALTPNRQWEATSAKQAVSDVVRTWFDDDVEFNEPLMIETDDDGGCARVGYRFRGHEGERPFVVEQQAFYETRDGRISWMRLVCSGLRTIPADG
jgi:hypothetical protein